MQKLAHKAISLIFAWSCRAKATLQDFFWSCCMELSRKSCLTKVCLKLLHGTVMQKLPFEVFPQAFVWACRANAAFRNYFLSFCTERSCFFVLFMLIHHFAERYVELSWAKSWALSWAKRIWWTLAETTFAPKYEDSAQDVHLETLDDKLETLAWKLII